MSVMSLLVTTIRRRSPAEAPAVTGLGVANMGR